MKKHLMVFFFAVLSMAHAENLGSWSISESVDPLTDVKKVIVSTRDTTGKTALVLRCTNQELEVYLTTPEFLNTGSNIPAGYRFDAKPAVFTQLTPSTDGMAGFFGDKEGRLFANELRTAEKGIFRVQKYSGKEFTYSFQFSRNSEVLKLMSCLATPTE